MLSSQVPKAVAAWKTDLVTRGKKKIAEAVADPSGNPELFEEGWEDALAREKGVEQPAVNGVGGMYFILFGSTKY